LFKSSGDEACNEHSLYTSRANDTGQGNTILQTQKNKPVLEH